MLGLTQNNDAPAVEALWSREPRQMPAIRCIANALAVLGHLLRSLRHTAALVSEVSADVPPSRAAAQHRNEETRPMLSELCGRYIRDNNAVQAYLRKTDRKDDRGKSLSLHAMCRASAKRTR